MKKQLLILCAIIICSCNTSEKSSSLTVGEWYTGELKGKSFKLGEQKNIDLVKMAGKYYNAQDAKNLASLFSENAKIYTHSGEMLEVSEALYENYFASLDSLKWVPHGLSTQTLEDNSIAVVSIPSSDSRYLKNGEILENFLFERFWIVNDKIQTIVQYKRELPKNFEEIEF